MKADSDDGLGSLSGKGMFQSSEEAPRKMNEIYAIYSEDRTFLALSCALFHIFLVYDTMQRQFVAFHVLKQKKSP